MSAIGDLVATMGLNIAPLQRNTVAAGQSFRRLGGMAVATSRTIMTAFLPVTGALAFVQLIRSGNDFNTKMRQSLAIMGDVSDAMRVDMREAAFAVASATKISAAQAAEAYYFLASAGLTAEQSIAALPQVAAFAQAGNFDLSTATSLAADAQSALGMKSRNAQENLVALTRVTDVLTKANTLANATTEQFSTSLTTKAGAAARAVGKEIEEVVAVLATFADQGIKGEEAGTMLGIVMRELQTKAIGNETAFAAAGVSVFDASGEMRNMADIFESLSASMAGTSDQAKKTRLLELGFTDRSIAGIYALLGTADKIRAYETQLREAGGITQEVADKQISPLNRVWAVLSSAATRFGDAVITGLNSALSAMAPFVGDLKDIASGIGAVWNATWNGIGSVATSVLTTMGFSAAGFGESVHSVLQFVASAFEGIGFTVRNLGNIMKLTINNAVIYWLELFPSLTDAIQGIGAVFVGMWAGVKAFFGTIIDNIIGGLKEVQNFLIAIGEGLAAAWQSITAGDFANAASAAAGAFVAELSSQADVQAPNAFKAFNDASKQAVDDYYAGIEKSGGMTNWLKEQNKAIQEEIARNEAGGAAARVAAEAARVEATTGLPAAGTLGAASGKTELPKALERGSEEAWNKIVSAFYGDQTDAAEATADNTARTAAGIERLLDSQRPIIEFEIGA